MVNRTLYFGDNLEILREKIPDESFDLIYLDPPFNSKREYNVLFKEGLVDSPAQVQAFEDTWHWTNEVQKTFDELINSKVPGVSDLMLALEKIVRHNDVMAYLVMMTVRLIELHRVLRKTGSIYLHCDPTASHYLKVVMDVIFGKKNFRDELVWIYEGRELSKTRYNRKHDILLFYTKSNNYTFNWKSVMEPLKESSRAALSRYTDKEGKKFILRYKKGGGFAPLEKEGPETYRQYLPEGVPPRDWFFADYARKSEQLGYETQKPEALLERVIKASSNKGDWVLDPFCGCGTTVAVAERLDRNWVGIDITMLAINLIRRRLIRQFGGKLLAKRAKINLDGLPRDLAAAKALFKEDPFEFQYWVLDMINAAPVKSRDAKRGPDRGIDGVITFIRAWKDGENQHQHGKAVVQVKGGRVQRSDIATLKGDVEREKAEAGIFVSLEEPTKSMKEEAASAGFFKTDLSKRKFPKIQIFTVEELLRHNKRPDLPVGVQPEYYKEAKKEIYGENSQIDLLGKLAKGNVTKSLKNINSE